LTNPSAKAYSNGTEIRKRKKFGRPDFVGSWPYKNKKSYPYYASSRRNTQESVQSQCGLPLAGLAAGV
jgi:hypothetical protein